MQERFSDPARTLMATARNEALRLHHDYLGTEHLLLALTRSRPSLACDVLEALGVDPAVIHVEVERRLLPGSLETQPRQLPFTPRAKTVLETILAECEDAGDAAIDTAHVLLALVRVGEGVAGSVLYDQGLTAEAVRAKSAELRGIEHEAMDPGAGDDAAPLRARLAACEQAILELQEALRRLERRLDGGPGT